MGKILTIKEVSKLEENLGKNAKKVVVAGGCFDILHPGHIAFIKAAKDTGDFLVVLLESDEAIQKMKGKGRPMHSQKERAEALSALSLVDFVVTLERSLSDDEYDELILALKPAIIATTKGDVNKHHKERQARLINAKVIEVLEPLPDYSTTKLIRRLEHI